MNPKAHKKLSNYWKTVIIIAAIALLLNILARIRPVCDFYADNIFRYISGPYSAITGIFPFSAGGVFIIAGIILLIAAVVLSFLLIFLRKRDGYRKFAGIFLKTILIIILSTGIIMTLNCSALYRCSRIDAGAGRYSDEELIKVYCYIVDKCNDLCNMVERNEYGEAVYPGDVKKAVRNAVKNMGKYDKRYSGYTPTLKPFINNYIYYQTGIIGEYYPFSMEANCSKYLNDLNMASTGAHEYSHLKGYIYEAEANFMGFLTCIRSDDEFLQYAGYLSVLWYLTSDVSEILQNRTSLMEEYDIPLICDAIWEWDYETYKIEAKKIIQEKPSIIPDKVVSGVSEAITDSYLNYYESEADYDKVTELVLWYYIDGEGREEIS